MVMGKIVSHTTYEYYEYVTAILISIGMTLFMLDSSDHKNGNTLLNMQCILIALWYDEIYKHFQMGLQHSPVLFY